MRTLREALDAEARELFAPKSRTKVINCAIEEYREARSEVRKLSISAAAVKQKQAELEAAKNTHEQLKAESESLQHQLVRLRRIASNKPDIARLQELRDALIALESVPALPVDARKQRDEAVSALAGATGQIQTLNGHISERKERIGALPVSNALKAHMKEIEELNAGTSDYNRAVSDRPKRLNERAEAVQLAEDGWRAVWHQHPISDAAELKTAYSRKGEIFGLITEHARLSTALEEAEESVRNGNDEQDHLRKELALQSDPGDPATLVASIEQAKSLGDTDQAIARVKSDVERLTAGAIRGLKKLPNWSRSIQEFEALKTPLLTTIEQYAHEWEVVTAARREQTSRLSQISEAIREKQVELDRLVAEVGGAGEKDLIDIRTRRDQLWQLIQASAFEKTLSSEDAQQQSGSSASLGEIFAEHLHRADEIADVRFANAKAVALHDRLVKEISSLRDEQQRIKGGLAKLEGEDHEVKQRWTTEWSALGCSPLSPAEMKEWMQLRQTILNRLEQAREKEKDIRVLQDLASAAADQINGHLAELAWEGARENESLPILLKVADGFSQGVQEQRRTIKDIRRRLQFLSLEKRQAKLDDCKGRLSQWSDKWAPVVRDLLLPDISTPDRVQEAISVLDKVFDHLKDAERLEYRVKRIGDNIEIFEKHVSQLVAATDPSLGSLPPGVAVTQLHLRLGEMGRAEAEREALEAQTAKDEAVISNCSSKAQLAEATLKQLRTLTNCSDDLQLEAIIAAAEQKTTKREEYDRMAVGLIERNAAPDVRQIEEEASAHELDSLKSKIGSIENRQQTLQDEVFRTGSEHGRLLQEFDQLQASDESTLHAQRAEDALARVRPAVAQYLRLQLASEVLQRAIESYRDKHQGPVLNRAGELFSRLTIGDHQGLTTSFGDDDKPVLVAIRRNGEHVEVEGLSDGTRDQLYLALRLAGIEHHVETVAPCPVIFDDILINSDDARASATLDVLGDLARRTQVLFFTHHRHLAEFGIAAGAQMIELNSSTASGLA